MVSRRDYHREYEARRVAAGLCSRCGQPRGESSSRRMCDPCLDRQVAYQRERYQDGTAGRRLSQAQASRERVKAAGCCVDCGAPKGDGFSRCQECRTRRRDAMRQKRRKK